MPVVRRMLAVLGLLAIIGCASPGSDVEISSADYGVNPTNSVGIAKSYFEETLKDPFSARYRFKKPFKAYLRNAPILGGGPKVFGYMVYVDVNAKNSYGAYVGWKSYRLLIRNGVVVGAAKSNPWFSERWYE